MKLKNFIGIFVVFMCGLLCVAIGVGREDNESVQEDRENVNNENDIRFLKEWSNIPEMDIKTENGHITGVILIHDGKSYALTEEEYLFLHEGGEFDELLSRRLGNY